MTRSEALQRVVEALRAADSIMWMAEDYAEAGGMHGPEMRDYTRVKAQITEALAALDQCEREAEAQVFVQDWKCGCPPCGCDTWPEVHPAHGHGRPMVRPECKGEREGLIEPTTVRERSTNADYGGGE